MHKAMLWKKIDNNVQCQLCPRFCFIQNNKTGYCGVRQNKNGKLYSLVYARPCSLNIDPIEKKPFFHFVPGSKSLSISTVGCNFGCLHCQNWEISQYPKIYSPNEIEKSFDKRQPKHVFDFAKQIQVQGMSWTYTEPTVFFEYFFDTAKLDRKKQFYQTWVSNGYTTPVAIKAAAKFLDAVNVDYKGDDTHYRNVCDAMLEPVRKALKTYKKHGVWLEITNLLIPDHNDSKDIILEMVKWISENLGKEVPLHFSAYYPAYKMHVPSTTVEQLERAIKIADEYLNYVYIGNVRHERENTFCPNCRTMVIKRSGFSVEKIDLTRKKNNFYCPKCNRKIPVAGAKWIQEFSH